MLGIFVFLYSAHDFDRMAISSTNDVQSLAQLVEAAPVDIVHLAGGMIHRKLFDAC